MRGQYSTKSDVFSFGILVIEIVTGQRNTGHYLHEQNKDIISIVSTLLALAITTLWPCLDPRAKAIWARAN